MPNKFELNFQDLFLIDTTPEGATRTWKRLGAGISGFDPDTNEDVAQDKYLDGAGYGSSDVIGAQLTFAVSGNRVVGDPAQDYIASKEFDLGDDRKTNFRAFDSLGNMRSGLATICKLKLGGGDASGKKQISFELHINGKPAKSNAQAAGPLTATIAAGTTVGTTKVTATAGATNTLAFRLSSAPLSANANAYPGAVTAYTSEDEIVAAVGQSLNVYELNEFGRVVNFNTHVLASADVKA